jgi:hypothetical protein
MTNLCLGYDLDEEIGIVPGALFYKVYDEEKDIIEYLSAEGLNKNIKYDFEDDEIVTSLDNILLRSSSDANPLIFIYSFYDKANMFIIEVNSYENTLELVTASADANLLGSPTFVVKFTVLGRPINHSLFNQRQVDSAVSALKGVSALLDLEEYENEWRFGPSFKLLINESRYKESSYRLDQY